MASLANNQPPDPRPTGDLEYLFRQKLGEAEVPPRQHVWEQLDHELLVRQNDSYRRRLVFHRWVAAACVLLVLGCGAWLLLHGATHIAPQAEIAATASSANPTLREDKASAQLERSSSNQRVQGRYATSPAEIASNRQVTTKRASVTQATPSSTVDEVVSSLLSAAKSAVGMRTEADRAQGSALAAVESQVSNGGTTVGASSIAVTEANKTQSAQGASGLIARPIRTLAERPAVASAFRRPETLQTALPASANMLAQTAINAPQVASEEAPPVRTRGKWRLSGTYAAASFNPNIDFSGSASGSRSNLDYGPLPNNGMLSNTARYQDAAAGEYRDNLEAGPAQRVVLAAAYAVNKHWTLLTGLETAQQRASSRTSYALNDNSSAFAARSANTAANSFTPAYIGQSKTDFTYRTVGVPVAVRYGSSKTGVSLYAKVGAAVNVLLKSRTEVDGNSDAARNYTLSSSDSPYRKVLASVRGGGGVRYQPTDATWSLALGPVAEAGLNTLNQNPGGSFFNRSRPYSVGLEASVEFGGQKSAAIVR